MMVSVAERLAGAYMARATLPFIEQENQEYITLASITAAVLRPDFSDFPLFLRLFYGKLSVRVSVQITLPYLCCLRTLVFFHTLVSV